MPGAAFAVSGIIPEILRNLYGNICHNGCPPDKIDLIMAFMTVRILPDALSDKMDLKNHRANLESLCKICYNAKIKKKIHIFII